MAKITFGMALAHGPMLTLRPEDWDLRVKYDKANPRLHFRGKTYSFDELAALRKSERLADQSQLERRHERQKKCRDGLEHLADEFAKRAPDVVVIVGNDQEEMYLDELKPALAVYWGEKMENLPSTGAQIARMEPGIHLAEPGHTPPQEVSYPGAPALGKHIITCAMADGFDVAQSTKVPRHEHGWTLGIPHAFGFVYRQVMRDRVVPNVPVLINTFYPPNQPSALRCWNFGRSIGRAIHQWQSDQTVGVIASGGLSHFVVDEVLDRKVLDALRTGDADALTSIDESIFESGTSEIKNWIAGAGILAETSLRLDHETYVPCYRSEAGTGSGMGFVTWT